MSASPFFSIVTPVLNGGEVFRQSLQGLADSTFVDWELIVVDDGSIDGSIEAAKKAGALVLSTSGGCGPGAARNLGAERARGEYLLFLDADCEVHADTLELAAKYLRVDPALGGLFGSYDRTPSAPSLVSRYRNLLHHFTHQQAASEASTFWAGCGVVKRSLFWELGGFDITLYDRPCIEDIEFGLRMRAASHRILLAKDVLVTHHKRWTIQMILLSDFFDRALPWTRLILQNRGEMGALNLDWRNRASTAVAYLTLLMIGLAPIWPQTAWGSLAGVIALLLINLNFYALLYSSGGVRLTLVSLPLHWIYFLNNGLAFGVGSLLFLGESQSAGRGDRPS